MAFSELGAIRLKQQPWKRTLLASSALAMALSVYSGAPAAAFTNPVDCSNPVSLEPGGIVGKGPNGEAAAGPKSVALSEEDAAKVRAGKFKVGLVFQFMNDWSRDQIAAQSRVYINPQTFQPYPKILEATAAPGDKDIYLAPICLFVLYFFAFFMYKKYKRLPCLFKTKQPFVQCTCVP